MTTVTVDNINMTLMNARFANDDQQVPDFVVSVVAAGRSGKTATVTKRPPHLPDFTSLLKEAQNTTSLSTPDVLQDYLDLSYPSSVSSSSQPCMDTTTATTTLAYFPEDTSIYDGTLDGDTIIKEEQQHQQQTVTTTTTTTTNLTLLEPPMQTSFEAMRPTSLPLAPSPALPPQFASPASSSSSSCSPQPDTFHLEQTDCDKVEEERNALSTMLAVPKDPYTWEEEHVQRWVSWACNKYSIPSCHQSALVAVNGPTLCSLTRDDFVRRTMSHDAAQCLYVDLDWWKSAMVSPMESSSPLTYTDLTSPSSNPMVSSAAVMPTPTPTPTSSVTSPSELYHTSVTCASLQSPPPPTNTTTMSTTEIPTPVLEDYDLTKATLYQLNHEVEQQQFGSFLGALQQQQQQQQQPTAQWDDATGASCDSSLNSLDLSLLRSEVKQEAMESEEDEEEEEGADTEAGRRRYVSHSKHTIHLWQFLKNLLLSPDLYGSYIKWLDQAKGIFKIENSREVAKLWGQRKNRPAMNYDKLSRSIRQYYKKGIIKKTQHSKRLVYQFQPTYL